MCEEAGVGIIYLELMMKPADRPGYYFSDIRRENGCRCDGCSGSKPAVFLKSKGKEKGTYVRVGGTSRLADPEKIRELEYEGERVSWDEQICINYPVTEAAVKKLCRDIKRYRKEMQEIRENAGTMPRVTRAQLINWNVLTKRENGYMASNAFALLTGRYFHYSKTQCAVFAGT